MSPHHMGYDTGRQGRANPGITLPGLALIPISNFDTFPSTNILTFSVECRSSLDLSLKFLSCQL